MSENTNEKENWQVGKRNVSKPRDIDWSNEYFYTKYGALEWVNTQNLIDFYCGDVWYARQKPE